jgi:hypothetical protein
VLKINENLAKLRDEFNSLTPIFDDNSYKHINNQIIIYELKLKELEQKSKRKTPISSLYTCAECLKLKPKKMCGKCVEKLNNVSTQTAKSYNFIDENDINYTTSLEESSSVDNYSLTRANKNRFKQKSRKNSNTNGKQLLLEAYLNKNTADSLNLFKTETTTTHESGMGTFNEEDDDDDYVHVGFEQKSDLTSKPIESQDKNLLSELSTDARTSNDENSYFSKELLNDYLKKLLSFFLTFFVLFLIVASYHIYYLFNPVCCDFKRNYLFINLT